MLLLYNLSIYFYFLLVLIFSLFNKKARLWLNGRKNWHIRLKQATDKDSKIIWIHCSSLGEFEQGRPIIEEIKTKYPEIKILLTFFSPSGYEIRKNYHGADYIFYLPLDTRLNAKRLINTVKPAAAIFVKYEFWYYYLYELNKQRIPTYIVSAIFRDDQVFFKPYGKWYRKFLLNFTHFFVQNERSKELLNSIGLKNVTIAGDTRFDRVVANTKVSKVIPILEEFANGSFVLIAGSTWPKDEELLTNFFNNSSHKIKLIVAPHEINNVAIQRLRNQFKEQSILYTKPDEADPKQSRVLIIDTIGILAFAYRYGNIAYIGGGFGAGIHNTLEAAAYGLPVIFGPNHKKFQEAKDLVNIGSAFPINNQKDLNIVLDKLIDDNQLLSHCNAKAKDYIFNGVGASSLIIKLLENEFLKFPYQQN